MQQKFEGCDECFNTGFVGRKPVMSQLLVDKHIKSAMLDTPMDIRFDDQMSEMAKKLFENNEIPWSEVIRLE
jgi:hypothetical protein